MNSKIIIKAENLSIGFNQLPILSNANFEVRQGEIFTILGGSGCGKTTLMRNLIGLETPISGDIFLNNTNITTAHSSEKKQLKKDLGVMFQSGALLSSMSLIENVMLPLNEHTKLSKKTKQAIALLKLMLVGLEKYAHYAPSSVSGGMVKRAAIARAMALDPSVIFLDEPSAGLDPITSRELDQLILDLSRNYNITFVMVTHELESIRRISDRAIVLNGGQIIANDSIYNLENNSNLPFVKQFFNGKNQDNPQ